MISAFDAFWRDRPPQLPIGVAYSGGADSTALLLACAEAWPGQVHAIHVHHGLQAAADDFAAHCEALCRRLDVPLVVRKVHAAHAPGESPESAARDARYGAFEALVLENGPWGALKTVAIAQHADDQVETILLALSRGAGLPGLAAMPERWERMGVHYCRPLLAVAARDIRLWLAARGLQPGRDWVEDPSNANERFTRNRIRARLLPVLDEVFPQFRETFARSARHAAHAQALLTQIATEDLARIGLPPKIAELQALGAERQANALRHWLRTGYGVAPSTAQLQELQSQIAACTTRGHSIDMKVASGFLRRQGQVLEFVAMPRA